MGISQIAGLCLTLSLCVCLTLSLCLCLGLCGGERRVCLGLGLKNNIQPLVIGGVLTVNSEKRAPNYLL
jgi:hypothetical protein